MSRTHDIELRSSDHFGARLRARRESYGFSLSDVSELTNIKTAYISAIEALDEAALPAIGYTIGYVRTYAEALGLDGALAVKDYKADTAQPHMKLRDAPHVILRRQLRLPRGAISAFTVASVALGIGLWYGTQSAAIATPTPAVDIAPQYTAAEPATPLMQPGLFTLRTTAPSWVEVRNVQGEIEVSRIFVKGETWQGPTAGGYIVSVRDAGAVQLYDGEALIGALGENGQPLTGLALSRLNEDPLPPEDPLSPDAPLSSDALLPRDSRL